MTITVFDLSDNSELANQIINRLDAKRGKLESRYFPDGEIYQRVLSDVKGDQVVVFANLFRPDPQLFSILSLGHTLKEIEAAQIILVAPYLPYMRQDVRFHAGESVTSRHFARHLSLAYDQLITVDPHLHRYHSLDQIYSLKGRVVNSQQQIANYLKQKTHPMILFGPDEESEQWVSAIANAAGLPYQILCKERRGDLDVSVSKPALANYKTHQPVLIDDIISSGRTMLSTLDQLEAAGMPQALIIGVHGLFASDAFKLLSARAQVITTNTVPHSSNAIDLSRILSTAIASGCEVL